MNFQWKIRKPCVFRKYDFLVKNLENKLKRKFFSELLHLKKVLKSMVFKWKIKKIIEDKILGRISAFEG